MVHYKIQWACNQMIKIKSRILDIKTLTERNKLTNGAKIEGPNWWF